MDDPVITVMALGRSLLSIHARAFASAKPRSSQRCINRRSISAMGGTTRTERSSKGCYIAPNGFVQQQVIAFQNDQRCLFGHGQRTGNRQFPLPVEQRREHLVTLLQTLDERQETGRVERLRCALAVSQAPGFQDGIIEVKSIHRHGDAAGPFRERMRQRRLAGCGRTGDADDRTKPFRRAPFEQRSCPFQQFGGNGKGLAHATSIDSTMMLWLV